jgi:hypothetical protein
MNAMPLMSLEHTQVSSLIPHGYSTSLSGATDSAAFAAVWVNGIIDPATEVGPMDILMSRQAIQSRE